MRATNSGERRNCVDIDDSGEEEIDSGTRVGNSTSCHFPAKGKDFGCQPFWTCMRRVIEPVWVMNIEIALTIISEDVIGGKNIL